MASWQPGKIVLSFPSLPAGSRNSGIALRAARRLFAGACFALLILTSVLPARAQVAGTVEAGLAQLAQEIAQKSKAAGQTTIAVLPFPHADGSCSVLSTYIVDELILTLFSVPNAQIKIVERSQLEAIIAELGMGAGGLLNPATTKQLGNLSGVSALTIGTITVIGDTIRLNARLVATESGETVSAAAVTVPKTEAITSLLSQSAACAGAAAQSTAGPSGKPVTPSPSAPLSLTAEGLEVRVQSIARRKDKTVVTLALAVVNTTEKPIELIWLEPVPTLIDDQGYTMYAADMSGHRVCNWDPGNCPRNDRDEYTTLSPGVPSMANWLFSQASGKGDKTLEGKSVSFSGSLQVLIEDGALFKNIAVSIPNIAISE